MRGFTRTLLRLCVAIAAFFASAAYGAELKDGWSEPQLAGFTAGCVQSILIPAKRDFAKAAAKAGNAAAQFPEAQLRPSVEGMCSCLARRVATTWSFEAYRSDQEAHAQPLHDLAHGHRAL